MKKRELRSAQLTLDGYRFTMYYSAKFMVMEILDGNATAARIKQEIKTEVDQWVAQGKRRPHLAAILVGENGASLTYVSSKVKSCEEVGFQSTLIQKPDTITQDEMNALIDELNADDALDGYIVQLPLPKHLDEQALMLRIHPTKDVDGFHPENVGLMALNMPRFLPATPAGIVELLRRYHIDTSGKHCVVIGRSHIVGLPMTILMQRNAQPGNCTVTITHSKTKDLPAITRQADIIVAALGKPGFVTADMVKEGAIVVDVGITRVPDSTKKSGFRIAGDVDYVHVAPKCSFITPVPGGVGPMTIVSLLQNTLLAAQLSRS